MFPLQSISHLRKHFPVPPKGLQLEKEIVQALRNQIPVRDLPGVRLRDVKTQPTEGFDVEIQLESGQRSVLVYGEIKPAVSPKLLE